MAASESSWIPATGRHHVNIGPSLGRALKVRNQQQPAPPPAASKRSIPDRDFYSFRYNLKPPSIDSSKTGTIIAKKGEQASNVVVDFPSTQPGESHVFLGQEIPTREWDCLLIYDEETGTYTLEKLDSSMNLTLDRKSGKSGGSSKGKNRDVEFEAELEDILGPSGSAVNGGEEEEGEIASGDADADADGDPEDEFEEILPKSILANGKNKTSAHTNIPPVNTSNTSTLKGKGKVKPRASVPAAALPKLEEEEEEGEEREDVYTAPPPPPRTQPKPTKVRQQEPPPAIQAVEPPPPLPPKPKPTPRQTKPQPVAPPPQVAQPNPPTVSESSKKSKPTTAPKLKKLKRPAQEQYTPSVPPRPTKTQRDVDEEIIQFSGLASGSASAPIAPKPAKRARRASPPPPPPPPPPAELALPGFGNAGVVLPPAPAPVVSRKSHSSLPAAAHQQQASAPIVVQDDEDSEEEEWDEVQPEGAAAASSSQQHPGRMDDIFGLVEEGDDRSEREVDEDDLERELNMQMEEALDDGEDDMEEMDVFGDAASGYQQHGLNGSELEEDEDEGGDDELERELNGALEASSGRQPQQQGKPMSLKQLAAAGAGGIGAGEASEDEYTSSEDSDDD